MKKKCETFAEWCFKEMLKLVMITFVISCLIDFFIPEIDFFLIVSILCVHCVVLVGATFLVHVFYKSKIWNIIVFGFVFAYSCELSMLFSFFQLIIYFFIVEMIIVLVNGVYYVVRKNNCWKILKKVSVAVGVIGSFVGIYLVVKKVETGSLLFSMGDFICYALLATVVVGLKAKDMTDKDEHFKEIYANCYYSGVVERYIWSMLFIVAWVVVYKVVILMRKAVDILGV